MLRILGVLALVAALLWAAWVSRELSEPRQQIVTVRLAETIAGFVDAEARTQQDPEASLQAICSRCVSLDEDTAVAPVAESVRAYEQAYRRYRQLVASTYGGQTPPELTPVAS